MDRRALPGLLAGLAGCAFVVAGTVASAPAATVVGAALALTAGSWSLVLLDRANAAERRADIALAELATLKELELATPGRSRSVIDRESGLPDGRFFEVAVETAVAGARRHLWPLTVVLVDLEVEEDGKRLEMLVGFSRLVRETLREADVVCRLGLGMFGLLLEDTNEAGGVWAAERLQAGLAVSDLSVVRLSAGVASYPTHGLDAGEVLDRARAALARAAATEPGFGLGHVEVARVEQNDRK